MQNLMGDMPVHNQI